MVKKIPKRILEVVRRDFCLGVWKEFEGEFYLRRGGCNNPSLTLRDNIKLNGNITSLLMGGILVIELQFVRVWL